MKKVGNILSGIVSFLRKYHIVFCLLYSVLLNLVMEMLCRHSIDAGFIHIVHDTEAFIYNTLIIFIAMLISLFFRKRAFAMTLLTVPFLTLAIINCAVLFYRVTPLSLTDFEKISSIFGIFSIYLEGGTISVIALSVILAIAALVILFIKCEKHKREWIKGLIALPVSVVLLIVLGNVFIENGSLSKKFTNMTDAYNNYGFNYCFMCSFDKGMSKPSDYSEEKVHTILDDIEAEKTLEPTEKPNIIFLQLESFFDVKHLTDASFSSDPTPEYTYLKENYDHGFMTVPYVGAGTANVEFEIISGMSLDFFGPGEYPYKTVLQTKACETTPFNLKELGYTTHAIHNHKGNFYDRAHVFSNLGFDTFQSLEFMVNAEYNPISWAKDHVLIEEINKALDSTENTDYIYTIGVQSHGAYPTERLEDFDYPVTCIFSNPKTEVSGNAFEYYLSQIRDVDTFVHDLLESLKARNEKTVVVLYGDHLPYFGIKDEELDNGSQYQTEYVIWSNYGISDEGKRTDLYTYELGAHVMKLLGMNNGLITKLHQKKQDTDEYMKYLEMLQYDMLYGKKNCFGYAIKYKGTDLKMGVYDLTVESVENTDDGIVVKGTEFTPFTAIYINKVKQKTEFVDANTLTVTDVEVVFGDRVIAAQTNGKRSIFTMSKTFVVGEDIQELPYEEDNEAVNDAEVVETELVPENEVEEK